MYLSLLDFSLLWLRLRERLLLGDLERDFDFFSYDPERLLKVKVKNIIRKKLAFYYLPSTNHLSPKVIHACERAWCITNPRIWTNPILNHLQGMPKLCIISFISSFPKIICLEVITCDCESNVQQFLCQPILPRKELILR